MSQNHVGLCNVCRIHVHVRCVVSSPMCTSCVCVCVCCHVHVLAVVVTIYRTQKKINLILIRICIRVSSKWTTNGWMAKQFTVPANIDGTQADDSPHWFIRVLQSICRETRMAFRCECALIQWCNHSIIGIQTSERAGVETAQFCEFYIPSI